MFYLLNGHYNMAACLHCNWYCRFRLDKKKLNGMPDYLCLCNIYNHFASVCVCKKYFCILPSKVYILYEKSLHRHRANWTSRIIMMASQGHIALTTCVHKWWNIDADLWWLTGKMLPYNDNRKKVITNRLKWLYRSEIKIFKLFYSAYLFCWLEQ